MQAQDYATVAVAVMTIIGGFAGAVRWMVKHYLNELKPNSGSSIKDKVEINSERLFRVEQRVDDIYYILAERD